MFHPILSDEELKKHQPQSGSKWMYNGFFLGGIRHSLETVRWNDRFPGTSRLLDEATIEVLRLLYLESLS